MKKVILLAVALMVLSSAVSANPGGWLDIFADVDHETWCLNVPPIQYVSIDVYFFARPPADGFMATDCKIVSTDPCLSIVHVTYHPNMNLAFGNWAHGMRLSFDVCQNATWVLCAVLRLVTFCPLSEGCQEIQLLPRDDSGFIGFATCAVGYPPEAAEHQINVYLNCSSCPDFVGTEARSWGAIKSLFK